MENSKIKKDKLFFIKGLVYLVILLTLGGCMKYIKGETERNRRLQPEEYFEGARMEMARAIHQNDKRKVESLLKQGINVNELSKNNDGTTYLLYSVILDNRIEIAQLLLDYGADPNQVSKRLSRNKYIYYLPLTFVADDQPIEYMKLLLKYGAKANYGYRDEKGKMPLYAMYPLNAAVRSSYILNKWNREDFMNDIKARIELLLEYGADINSIGAMGNTVVEWADSNPEIVLYLMDKGADHRLYGKELLRTSKRLLQASPNNIDRQEIIHRLEALGYK